MLNTGIKTKKPGTWLGAGSAGSLAEYNQEGLEHFRRQD